MKVERVFAGLPEEADKHEKKYVPLFKRKRGTKWNKPLLLCTALLLLPAFQRGCEFFSDVFRSYMSGNKPLTCGDGISGIALIELTLYNTSCIDKWLSTRPVFDAGLLPGIGAERSVE